MKSALVLVLSIFMLDALACGVCIDDKVAACYDHAVVTQAHAQGHEVAFFAVQGPLPANAESKAKLEKALQATAGVLRGTGRVSVENGALSFAYDPKRTNALVTAQRIEKRLAEPSLSLALLRVMN
ncbi:MAG TPA: hypothetical protein VIV54_22765 [Burkholderiales bacterium]